MLYITPRWKGQINQLLGFGIDGNRTTQSTETNFSTVVLSSAEIESSTSNTSSDGSNKRFLYNRCRQGAKKPF